MKAPVPKNYLKTMPLYHAGRTPGESAPLINLSANENPYGSPPGLLVQMQHDWKRLGRDALNRYPEQGSRQLRHAIAEKYSISPDNIICGNGSDELISQLAAAYLSPKDELIHAQYGFACYPLAARRNGAKPIAVKERNFTLTPRKIASAVTPQTKVIMLANPNNPTGFFMSDATLDELHQQIPPHVILMIDAAYAEYVKPSENDNRPYSGALALAGRAKNVLVTRTFSKAYGLATLRIGWGYGHQDIIAAMQKIAEPFNINALAQRAALLALREDDFVTHSARNNATLRDWLAHKLSYFDITASPSSGNFLLCDCGSAERTRTIFLALKQQGILLRHTESMGLPQHLRITVGTREQLNKLIETIKSNKIG